MPIAVGEDLWKQAFLEAVHRRVKQQVFDTWFRPLRVGRRDKSTRVLRLSAPNTVLKDWVTSHYSGALQDSLREVELSGYRIEWAIDSCDLSAARNPAAAEDEEEKGKHRSSIQKGPPVSEGSGVTDGGGALHGSLNAKYTFQSFVVGSCNQFAHAASQAVADAPGKCDKPVTFCMRVSRPVCGCNGKTYANDCERQRVKVQLDHAGACKKENPQPPPPAKKRKKGA